MPTTTYEWTMRCDTHCPNAWNTLIEHYSWVTWCTVPRCSQSPVQDDPLRNYNQQNFALFLLIGWMCAMCMVSATQLRELQMKSDALNSSLATHATPHATCIWERKRQANGIKIYNLLREKCSNSFLRAKLRARVWNVLAVCAAQINCKIENWTGNKSKPNEYILL